MVKKLFELKKTLSLASPKVTDCFYQSHDIRESVACATFNSFLAVHRTSSTATSLRFASARGGTATGLEKRRRRRLTPAPSSCFWRRSCSRLEFPHYSGRKKKPTELSAPDSVLLPFLKLYYPCDVNRHAFCCANYTTVLLSIFRSA